MDSGVAEVCVEPSGSSVIQVELSREERGLLESLATKLNEASDSPFFFIDDVEEEPCE